MIRESVALLTMVLALVLIGILMVYSATTVSASATAHVDGANEFGHLWKQLQYVTIGLLGMAVAVRFDYHRLASPRIYRPIVLLAFALLLLVLVPGIGVKVYGAQRWIQVAGFRFQPSEFAKMALIILLAVKLSSNQGEIKSFFRGFVPAVVVTFLFAALVFLEKDLGVPVVMIGVAFLMIFAAGTRWIFVITCVLAAGSGVTAIALATPHRVQRLVAFLDPWQYAQNEGFQLIQSMTAFARGSLLGQGPGASEQKLFYLPFPHSDFVFAVWGEEMGLVGTLLVVSLFVAFAVLSVRIAAGARDLFGTLLAAGIGGLISLQAAFNMCVTTGLLPTKGLPLPFISYGGSALIMNLALVGILLNVGLQAQAPERTKRYAVAH